VVAEEVNAAREVVMGQDNCRAAESAFAVLWYVDQGPQPCEKVSEEEGLVLASRLGLVPDDQYLAEPVCATLVAASLSGPSPSWMQISQALSTENFVAAGATESIAAGDTVP
jgi:hypothetical protein